MSIINFFFFNNFMFEILFNILFFFYLIYGTILNNHTYFNYIKVTLPFFAIFFTNLFFLQEVLFNIYNLNEDFRHIFNDSDLVFISNNFIVLFKLILLFFLGIWILLVFSYIINEKLKFEYFIIVFLSFLGSFLLISSNDFFILYLAIELQTFAFFLLIVLDAKKGYTVEAGLKYFVLNALSSGIYLLGLFFIYYNIGCTNFNTIYSYLLYNNFFESDYHLISSGFFFLLVMFLFKLSLVPFHNWVIDVYEGSSIITLILLTILPKISIFVIFFRVYHICFIEFYTITFFLSIIVLISMIIGSMGAIGEYKFKRIVGYSTISNGSFILLGLILPLYDSLKSVLLFLFFYFLSILGFLGYMFVLKHQIQKFNVKNIEFLNSIFFVNPVYASFLSIFFFSLAGLPPFLSFLAKFYLMYQSTFYFNIIFILIVIFVNIIAFYFYVRFIRLILFFNYTFDYSYLFYTNMARLSSYVLLFITYLQLFLLYYISMFFYNIDVFFLISLTI